MTSIISIEKKIIFFHIPKTGGTSISQYITDYDKSFFPINGSILNHRIFDGTVKIHESYLSNQNINVNDYVKITVVRNPLDRLFSAYKMISNQISLDKFIFHIQTQSLPDDFYEHPVKERSPYQDFIWHTYISQYDHCLNNKNEIVLDYIIKYENLYSTFKTILIKYDLPQNILEILKDSQDIPKYNDTVNDSQKKWIYEFFKKDFEYFNYMF